MIEDQGIQGMQLQWTCGEPYGLCWQPEALHEQAADTMLHDERRLTRMSCTERASLRMAQATFLDARFEDGFIFVYDMPSEFTDDLTRLPVQWHPSQYDYDQAGKFPLCTIKS